MQCGWRPLVRATANRLFNSFPSAAAVTAAAATNNQKMMPKLHFALSPQQITDNTAQLISEYKGELDKIGQTPVEQCSFDNVLVPLALLEGRFSTSLSSLTFPQYVHPDEPVRNACIAAQHAIDQFAIEKGMRQDIFKVVKAVGDEQLAGLKGEERRLVEKMLLEFKLNGLYLSKEQQETLKGYRQELAEAELSFSKAINADKTTIEFDKDELDGCSDAFLSSLEVNKETQKYIVTMKYPDLLGVMRNAKNEETRRRLSIVNDSRVPENMQHLAKAVELRAKAAKLLGFKDHTELQLADRMAKTPTAVNAFISDLIGKLKPKAEDELRVLKAIKLAETGKSDFNTWDFPYYSNKLTQERYSVDHELIREYFPVEHVSQEMLKIYEQVLGLTFEDVTSDPSSPLWQSKVRLFEVKDAGTHQLVGHVYFDLFPRDGKYTHAACFPLQPGYSMSPSTRQFPCSAMVCNFSKATAASPSLLKHDEVVTFFHELGHAMHGMCASTRFSRFHGTSTETDYVEAPSQMLENWCWEKPILKRLSKHYKTGEPLPDHLIDKLISSRLVNAGLTNLRQLFFATYDMTIHSHPAPLSIHDLNDMYAKLRHHITLLPQPANISPAATWGHLMGGYDAGYYGYMWSLVFSSDMYQSQFAGIVGGNGKDGVGAPGARYRQFVLGPGGSKDGMQMLVDFLGRPPTSDAFLKQLGL